jgi:hypothetical protein
MASQRSLRQQASRRSLQQQSHGFWDEIVVDLYRAYIEPFCFPKWATWPASSTAGFVSFVFWHSLVFTATTPLARLFRGRWMGVSSTQWVLNRLGLGWLTLRSGMAHDDSLFIYNTTKTVDKAFGLHAFFGLLWLISAYLQMGPIQVRSKALHRKFGYFASFALIGHILASLNNLYMDEAKHQPMAKMMLLSPVFLTITYFARSAVAIKNRDISGHTDNAILGFLYSIEGAGAIREVSQWQLWLKPWLREPFQGPGDCQSLAGGMATHCVTTYCMRMLFVRWFTLWWIGLYGKVKHDMVFTKMYVLEVMATICTSILTAVALSTPSFADWINSGPAISWALFLTYQVLTVAYYVLPLFQMSGQAGGARSQTKRAVSIAEPELTQEVVPIAPETVLQGRNEVVCCAKSWPLSRRVRRRPSRVSVLQTPF